MRLAILTLRIAHQDFFERSGEGLATALIGHLFDGLDAEVVDHTVVETVVAIPDPDPDGPTADLERWQDRARLELASFAATTDEAPGAPKGARA